ncbi:metallophosphoesterase [Geomonas limicola]|uniref:Metallophosphoesterase n=1 Tax=Geomonas limicola TaxID=2740186 RepID=A0A6V8N9G8_9BACT|nr:metallophosphoesterase [Geomonas limicola]GFO68534.1 metallophosphoesterase [Geomonas limicola]
MAAISRRMFLMGSASLFPYLYLERLSVAVRRYTVPVRQLPAAFEGFTILHLSDLHDKEFGTAGEELVALVQQEHYDVIAVTGDLVNGYRPVLTPALELLTSLRRAADRPVFAVLGNHDWRLERGLEFAQRLEEAGAQMLFNSAAPLERSGQRLWIAGVDDPITGRDRLDQALTGTAAGEPRVLLTHSPMLFPQATQLGLDLLLAGHTHGGQIRLPIVGAAYVPRIGFFPPWDYGLFRNGHTTLIVSGGLGESGLPIRINIRPELALVTLVNATGSPGAPHLPA